MSQPRGWGGVRGKGRYPPFSPFPGGLPADPLGSMLPGSVEWYHNMNLEPPANTLDQSWGCRVGGDVASVDHLSRF